MCVSIGCLASLAVFTGDCCDVLALLKPAGGVLSVCRDTFSSVIQDAEELDEAVQYLHNQGGPADMGTAHFKGIQECFSLSSLPPPLLPQAPCCTFLMHLFKTHTSWTHSG